MKIKFLILSGVVAGASIFGPSGSANAQSPYCDPYYAAYYGCYPYAYPYPVAYDPYYYGAPIAAAAIGTGLALGAAYNWGYGPWGYGNWGRGHWGRGHWGRGHGHWGHDHYGNHVGHYGGGM